MADLANNTRFTPQKALILFNTYMTRCAVLRGGRLGKEFGVQVMDLLKFLTTRTNYLTAPASTKYHLCCEAGLLMHSVGVTETALKLREVLCPEIPEDSVILCGLMHDVGKVYNRVTETGKLVPRYEPNVLKSTGRLSDSQPYKYVKGANEIPLTVKDLLIPIKFVDMSDAEMQALLFADGPYVPVNERLLHHEHPLSLVIHWADYWEGHAMEGGWKASDLSGIFRGKEDNPSPELTAPDEPTPAA